MKMHALKTAHDMWDAVARGAKTAEFRKDDRGFEVGDTLILVRLRTPSRYVITHGPAPKIERTITHIVRGPDYGIPEGYAMLSLATPSESAGSIAPSDDDAAGRRPQMNVEEPT